MRFGQLPSAGHQPPGAARPRARASQPAPGHSLLAEPPPPLTPLTEIDDGQPWSSAHGGHRSDTRRSAAGIQCLNTRITQ